MAEQIDKIKQALAAFSCLTLYRKIFDDDILRLFREVLALAAKNEADAVDRYFDLLGRLLNLQKNYYLDGIGIFQNHLLDTMLEAETSFSLQCEKEDLNAIDSLLVEAVKNDLRLLKVIYDFDLNRLGSELARAYKAENVAPVFGSLVVSSSRRRVYPQYYFEKREEFKKVLAGSRKWSENLTELHCYYRAVGSGRFARYWAFKWHECGVEPELAGIAEPDPIRMEDLVGYDDQKQEILRNTRQFVKGLSANNMLLYGDRGTGKSSMIKSLVHIFGAEGLRLIEVSKHDLFSLHRIIEVISGRAQRFIIFIDDLSFEEDETEYKELKALLEGSIARPPENVRVYATSNRRNLVREFFSDRESDEVGRQDTYQEKLSLADRFGIKLVFPTPDKWEYLKTVEAIAEKKGIDIDKAILHDLALKWVMWHNSRSGRTARQFVDDLKGRLDLEMSR